jgi:protein-disulfide isomerase-like protein with CxxC motif
MITLRLIANYRRYRKGQTIQASPGLAEILIAQGIAVEDRQGQIEAVAEHAVASRPVIRTAAK